MPRLLSGGILRFAGPINHGRKDPNPQFGLSVYLYNAPGIKSLCGFKNIKGAFVSGLDINYMNGLETLDGAEGITSVGVAKPLGYGFVISQNAVLTSAIALANTQYPPLSLDISNNSQLACVPQQWPLKDQRGNTIRNGKALHDPCLFSCNSTSGSW
jgi:hypothetical protein